MGKKKGRLIMLEPIELNSFPSFVEIDKMNNSQLDENVFRLVLHSHPIERYDGKMRSVGFSIDFHLAVEVVNSINVKHFSLERLAKSVDEPNRGWVAVLDSATAYGATAPEAICKAVLMEKIEKHGVVEHA